jgi:hypothetical protein
MNAFSKIDMGEVTRLTHAGKLAEAMALLQGHTASSIARGRPGSESLDCVGSGWRLDGSPSIQAAG